jgi:hypothetical protein
MLVLSKKIKKNPYKSVKSVQSVHPFVSPPPQRKLKMEHNHNHATLEIDADSEEEEPENC